MPSKAKYWRETDSEQVPWGKDEKNFGKRVKQYVKLLKGKRLKSVALAGNQPLLLLGVLSGWWVSINFDRWIKALGMWHLRMCYSPWSHTAFGIEELSTPQGSGFYHVMCLGCWHNGFNRPVLKHGPRSLTCMRVFGWKTHARNESEKLRSLSWGALTLGPDLLWRIRGRACMLGPERWWTMPE